MPIERGRILTRRGLFAATTLALVLWGCEGGHLFAPVLGGPQITDLSTTPSEIQSEESMTVSVRALGSVRVDSIVTTVRVGSFQEVGVARQTGVSAAFSAALDFSIPVSVSDTLATVEAYAVDAQNNVGPTYVVTVPTVDNGLPTVTVSLEDPRLGVGAEVSVVVSAQDNVALRQVGFRILDLGGALLDEFLVDQTGTTAQRLLTYLVPEGLPLSATS